MIVIILEIILTDDVRNYDVNDARSYAYCLYWEVMPLIMFGIMILYCDDILIPGKDGK